VIGEGVENAAQQAFFRAHGADLLQGFLLAKPMPEHEFIALLGMRAAAIAAHTALQQPQSKATKKPVFRRAWCLPAQCAHPDR